MKKEAISTFNEGLNYDLNPITTPNTVLTDCINGTFITFNGDELALQNDAGNTTVKIPNLSALEYVPDGTYEKGDSILITEDNEVKYYVNLTGENHGTLVLPDWKESVVQLSDGFYPLGIKEYGGILYIVSGKYPTVVPQKFEDTNSYEYGAIVYQTLLGVKYYYESLIAVNTRPLPYESTMYWLVIGTEKDFINKYGLVEFGSYPSPIVVDASQFDTSVNYNIINDTTTLKEEFKFELYKPQIINNSIFQAGVSATFFAPIKVATPTVTTNISYPIFVTDSDSATKTSDVRKYYKVKLFHQLTNGFIDLTDDVWNKYARFVFEFYGEQLNQSGSTRFWFKDPNFAYYCPHNFKGKLAISAELEELDKFKLGQLQIDSDAVNYTITFPVILTNTTQWGNTLGLPVILAYTIDGTEPNIYSTSNVSYNASSVVLTLPVGDVSGKELRYKLLPKFSYGNDILTPANDYFPQQFIDMHLISGRQLIVSELDQYEIKLDPSETIAYYCELNGSGNRVTARLTLFDNANGYLKPIAGGFEGSDVPYQFYLIDPDAPVAPANPLGTYTIGADGKAANVIVTNAELQASDQVEFITTLVENTEVAHEDETCLVVPLFIEVNKVFNSEKPIRVSQEGSYLPLIDNSPIYKTTVKPNVPFTIENAPSLGFKNNYTYTGAVSNPTGTTIKYGLVTDLEIIEFPYILGGSENIYRCYYNVNIGSPIFGNPIPPTRFVTVQTNPAYTSSTHSASIESGLSDNWMFEREDFPTENAIFTVTFNTSAINDYVNLRVGETPLDIALEGNNNIFLKVNSGLISQPQ